MAIRSGLGVMMNTHGEGMPRTRRMVEEWRDAQGGREKREIGGDDQGGGGRRG